MSYQEYPKALFRSGWDDLADCMVVLDADGERDARNAGFRSLAAPVDESPSESVAEAPKRRGRPPKKVD